MCAGASVTIWARFLPYIAGGFATNEVYLREDGRHRGLWLDNQRLNGWTIGAGVDVKLGNTFVGPLMLARGISLRRFRLGRHVRRQTSKSRRPRISRGSASSPISAATNAPRHRKATSTGPAPMGVFSGLRRMNVQRRIRISRPTAQWAVFTPDATSIRQCGRRLRQPAGPVELRGQWR